MIWLILLAVGALLAVPTAAAWRRTRRTLNAAGDMFDVFDVPCCRVCGCTEDRACPGGCWWVPDPQMGDLCSACAPTDAPERGRR